MKKQKTVSDALFYSEYLPVFPCHTFVDKECSCGIKECENPGRHSIIENGADLATRDHDLIEKNWEACPGANVGFPTGQKSKFVILEIVSRSKDFDSFSKIEKDLNDRGFFLPYPGYVSSHVFPNSEEVDGYGDIHQIYFFCPAQFTKSEKNILETENIKTMNLIAEGGIGLLPPSASSQEFNYKWNIPISDMAYLSGLPDWVTGLISKKNHE